MKIDEADFLELAERTRQLAFFDIEATGLRGDYNSILVATVKTFGEKPVTFTVKQPGNDKGLVQQLCTALENHMVICGYYSKGFDIPMLNTRLLKWGYGPISNVYHIDLYFTLKANLLTARKSQGHLLKWLNAPEEKMSVSAELWNEILSNPNGEPMNILKKRCESDVRGLELLYKNTKQFIKSIKKIN